MGAPQCVGPAGSVALWVVGRPRNMSRESFAVKLKEWLADAKGTNDRIWPDDEHAEAINFLVKCDVGDAHPVTAREHRWLQTLSVVDFGGNKKLVRKKSGLEIVKTSEIFDKINYVHISLGHAGRDKIVDKLGQSVFNISHRLVSLYLSTCAICD